MKHTIHTLCIRGLAAFLVTSVAVSARGQSIPANFSLEPVVQAPFGGYPIGFAFLPDGRIVVIEKDSGNIRLSAAGSGTSVVLTQLAGLRTDNERGLLGVAVDPAWPTRPYLYCMANYMDGRTRITLHAASGDLTQSGSTAITLAAPYVLVDFIGDNSGNHKGGTLRFGPDGMLYAATGDDSDVCRAQELETYNGKILRLDVAAMPQSGSGPPAIASLVPSDNPYAAHVDPQARLVYVFGLRNPFRFTIDDVTGDLAIGDVGAHAQEEIDVVLRASHVGANLGWPFYEGNLFVPAGCDEGGPTFVPPVYTYAHSDPVPYAVICGPRYRPVALSSVTFPLSYDGDVFFHDHYGGWIRRLVRVQGSWFVAAPVTGQADANNWATGMGHIADLQEGPDGALYLMILLGQGGMTQGLHRIIYTPTTDAAAAGDAIAGSAIAIPNPTPVGRGTTLQFRAPAVRPSELHVFDVAGHSVRALSVRPGDLRLHWDGRDQAGRPVGPGLYLYERRTDHGVDARGRLLVVR